MKIRQESQVKKGKLYTIATGSSSRVGCMVYATSVEDTVGLAIALSKDYCPVIGCIQEDLTTKARVVGEGQVITALESGIVTVNPQQYLFLSPTEAGKVTNVAPTVAIGETKISYILGISVQDNVGSLVLMNFSPQSFFVLHGRA